MVWAVAMPGPRRGGVKKSGDRTEGGADLARRTTRQSGRVTGGGDGVEDAAAAMLSLHGSRARSSRTSRSSGGGSCAGDENPDERVPPARVAPSFSRGLAETWEVVHSSHRR